jgi:hypothetical protein
MSVPHPTSGFPLLFRNLARQLHIIDVGRVEMDTLLILGALAGSFAGALIIQKAALEGLLRVMGPGRRSHG